MFPSGIFEGNKRYWKLERLYTVLCQHLDTYMLPLTPHFLPIHPNSLSLSPSLCLYTCMHVYTRACVWVYKASSSALQYLSAHCKTATLLHLSNLPTVSLQNISCPVKSVTVFPTNRHDIFMSSWMSSVFSCSQMLPISNYFLNNLDNLI